MFDMCFVFRNTSSGTRKGFCGNEIMQTIQYDLKNKVFNGFITQNKIFKTI